MAPPRMPIDFIYAFTFTFPLPFPFTFHVYSLISKVRRDLPDKQAL